MQDFGQLEKRCNSFLKKEKKELEGIIQKLKPKIKSYQRGMSYSLGALSLTFLSKYHLSNTSNPNLEKVMDNMCLSYAILAIAVVFYYQIGKPNNEHKEYTAANFALEQKKN